MVSQKVYGRTLYIDSNRLLCLSFTIYFFAKTIIISVLNKSGEIKVSSGSCCNDGSSINSTINRNITGRVIEVHIRLSG